MKRLYFAAAALLLTSCANSGVARMVGSVVSPGSQCVSVEASAATQLTQALADLAKQLPTCIQNEGHYLTYFRSKIVSAGKFATRRPNGAELESTYDELRLSWFEVRDGIVAGLKLGPTDYSRAQVSKSKSEMEKRLIDFRTALSNQGGSDPLIEIVASLLNAVDEQQQEQINNFADALAKEDLPEWDDL